MKINVHIERLIMDGGMTDARQAAAVKTELESELSNLFVAGGAAGWLRSGGAIPGFSAGSISMSAGSDPRGLGRQIARSVYGSLGRGK